MPRSREAPRRRLSSGISSGIDNSWFYVGLFPALYHTLGAWRPEQVRWVINYFLLLDGEKFSTSRRHAIWVQDVPATTTVRRVLADYHPNVPGLSLTQAALQSPQAEAEAEDDGAPSLPLTPVDFDPRTALRSSAATPLLARRGGSPSRHAV